MVSVLIHGAENTTTLKVMVVGLSGLLVYLIMQLLMVEKLVLSGHILQMVIAPSLLMLKQHMLGMTLLILVHTQL